MIRLNNISRRCTHPLRSKSIRCTPTSFLYHRFGRTNHLSNLSRQCNSRRVWRGAAGKPAPESSTASARVAPRSQGTQRVCVLRWTPWRSVPHLLHAVLDLCPATQPSLGLDAIDYGLVALAAQYSPPFSIHSPRSLLFPSALFVLTMGPLQFYAASPNIVLGNCSCHGRGQMQILVAQHLQSRFESRAAPKWGQDHAFLQIASESWAIPSPFPPSLPPSLLPSLLPPCPGLAFCSSCSKGQKGDLPGFA